MDTYNIALDCIDKNAQSLHNKHKPALIYVKDGSAPLRLNFSNLEGLTNRIANALKNLGLQKGERLVLNLPNCPDFPITFLGAIKAQLIPIPSSPLFTANELKYILEDSKASVLVTKDELLLCKEKKTYSWKDLLKNSAPQFITEPTLADDPAFWLYTSGTEGKPKAVIHAHRSIPAHDSRAKLWQDLRFNDVIFNTSSLNWSYALTAGMLDIWRHGLPTVIYDGPLSAEKICHLIKHFGVTTFMSVPGIYRRLVEYFDNHFGAIHESPLQGLRICNSAGEKLSEEIRRNFKKHSGLEIYEGLGMTEHSVYLVQRVGEAITENSCGKAIPNQKISILDEEGNELAPNQPGILASHQTCPGLMLGYKNEGFTPTLPLQKNYFLSGDLAQQDEAGNIFFLGRRDDVITAGGYRISPLEVESTLNEMDDIFESAVIGKEENGKTIVCAFIVLKEAVSLNNAIKEKILSQAAQKLAKYKCPKKIEFVNSLPKSTNGKLKRKELTSWLIS